MSIRNKKITFIKNYKMSQVLVLNYDFKPINVTSIRRGFILVNKGKAEIIKSDDSFLKTEYNKYVKPLIIRLLNYIKYSLKELKVNRKRIFTRDNFECVYCGYKKKSYNRPCITKIKRW